jgi:hypothetical protein
MGFEILKNIIAENKRYAEEAREEERNPTECDECWWPLDVNSEGGKSCPICGRIWSGHGK